jgi:hypothetical protein
MTLAAAGFGRFINHLLVGDFSYLHGEINAFDPTNGKLAGTIPIAVGKGHTPGGLWAIKFGVSGSGGSNGDPNTLYFSDGINGENDGLFGAIFANGTVHRTSRSTADERFKGPRPAAPGTTADHGRRRICGLALEQLDAVS